MTTVHHAAQVDRATRLGLRPSTVTVCPLSVLGRRCRTRYAEVCICQRHHRLLDHGRVWVDDRGRRVLTGEPYDLDPVEVVDLAADLAPLGLAVELVPGPGLWHERTRILAVTEVSG